jgi:hypothetical protein
LRRFWNSMFLSFWSVHIHNYLTNIRCKLLNERGVIHAQSGLLILSSLLYSRTKCASPESWGTWRPIRHRPREYW